MKLIDLKPKWFNLEEGGIRVGLTFECPHCFDSITSYSNTRIGVSFHERGKELIEDTYIHAHTTDPFFNHIWEEDGEDFYNITLTPSIDVSHAGHWHGFLIKGEISNA